MMGLMRWPEPALDLFDDLAALSDAVDRAFAELGFPAGALGERGLLEKGVAPSFRIAEEGDGYHLALDLPGVQREALEVKCLGDTVTVEGEWPEPALGEGATAWRQERPRGRFLRSVSLGEPIDPTSASATLQDGVLHVRVKKAPEAKGRRIPVRS